MKRSLLLVVLAVAILLVLGASSAFAGTLTTVTVSPAGVGSTAAATVTVNATIRPKLVLQIDAPDGAQTVNFGNVDPGLAYGGKSVIFTVWTNRNYDLTITKVGAGAIGLNTTAVGGTNLAKSANDTGIATTDNYSLQVPWSTADGTYAATVNYTVVQR
jgi:hypothetical protein